MQYKLNLQIGETTDKVKDDGATLIMHILLVGNNTHVNTFIEQLLENFIDMADIEQISNISKLLAEKLDPSMDRTDLLIVDFSAYGSSKILDKIEKANKILPQTPKLVIHDYQQPSLVKPLWNKGIDGYVPADRLDVELLPALSTIKRGARYISSDLLKG